MKCYRVIIKEWTVVFFKGNNVAWNKTQNIIIAFVGSSLKYVNRSSGRVVVVDKFSLSEWWLYRWFYKHKNSSNCGL